MFGFNKKEEPKEEIPEPPRPPIKVKATTKALFQKQDTSLQEKIMAEFQENYSSLNLSEDQALQFATYVELRLIRDILASQKGD